MSNGSIPPKEEKVMSHSERSPERVLGYIEGVEYPAYTQDLLAAAEARGAPEEVMERLRSLGAQHFAGAEAVRAALMRPQETGRAGYARE